MPTVLAILAEGFEEIEAITPIDLLRRAGAGVTLAALGEALAVRGRNDLIVQAEHPLAAVAGRDYDCVFLPGGPGVARLRTDPTVRDLVRRHHAAGKLVAAICAAPVVLLDAGVLAGHRHTAHASVAAELPGLLPDERVVRDGNVLTSRGAGTALDFGLALVTALFDAAASERIAVSIHA